MTARPPPGATAPEPPPVGKCRICGDDSWRRDELGPAHPCCVVHARENPGRPCLACEASRKPAGGADATPSSSRQEGVDNATRPLILGWTLTGPWGVAAAGLPVSSQCLPSGGHRAAREARPAQVRTMRA